MSGSELPRWCSSAATFVIPDSKADKRVSLNGYKNIVLEVSNNKQLHDEDKYKVRGDTLPVNKVGFFSYIFLTWLSPLVWKMFLNRSKPFDSADVWQCSDEEGIVVNTERIKLLWKEEIETNCEKKSSFERVWRKFICMRTLIAVCILALNALASFATSAFLLNQVVGYLESSEDNLALGLGLTAAMLCCEVTRSLSCTTLMLFTTQTGTRFRSGLMGLIYNKLLKLRLVKGSTNSEIINAFSIDSYRIYMATRAVPCLLVVPVYLIIGTGYCYSLIGYWCFVSIGAFTVCYLGQTLLSRFISVIRKKCVHYTDLRVRRMREILNSIKFVKMYAWEKPFVNAIKDVRKSEQKYMLYSALVNAVIWFVVPVTPTIASVVTITIYTAAGNDLLASTAFAVIGTMNFMRNALALVPYSLRAYGEAKVSFARIKRLLILEEFETPSTEVSDKENAVEIKAANFIWDLIPDQTVNNSNKIKNRPSTTSIDSARENGVNNFALSDINFKVHKGTLVGICGSFGSGKSSLMSAVMGRMLLQKGDLAVNGEIAYVAQQAWIFNATLKENILFGSEFDEDKYQRVINCCGLMPDIKLLTEGDETEIGERGVNLSGGQKQRVSLARAVYSESDIFILDDPLSALDVKVGRQIFYSCIKGILKDKSVLLVTHQLQYLKHCDELVVMYEGCIEEKGQHHELLAMNGRYADMFRIFDQTTMKSIKPEDSGDANIKNQATPQKGTSQQNGEDIGGNFKSKETRKGDLVSTEEAAVGSISFATYNAYIRAGGGWIIASFVFLVYLISSGSVIFTDWWLSQWITSISTVISESQQNENPALYINSTENVTATFLNASSSQIQLHEKGENDRCDTYFIVYTASLGGIIALQLVKSFIGAKAAIVASNKLHSICLNKIIEASMSFFDSTPVGRILNRFSKDLDEGDVFIPQVTNSFLQMFTMVILSIAVSAYIVPWMLIAMVPIVIVFYIIKQMSVVSIRQLKRLENISRSPLINHVNMTSQGLSTIVAYRQQDRYFEKCTAVGNVAAMSIFLFEASMQWLEQRLDLMVGMITVSTSLIFVLTKGHIPPAFAGLVLSLCGKTVSIVQFLVRLMNELEARFTSVERLHEYNTKLTSEPQHAKKMAKPGWPDKGSVTFNDVMVKYRPDMDPVLRNINFVIQAKEKVGVVGRTGAGKSTLAAALFRLVELSGGTIFVDGEDIASLPLSTIRSKLSTITQEPVLFAGTIRC